MISSFQTIKLLPFLSSLPNLLHLQPIINPNKTLPHFQLPSTTMSSSSSSSSWACSKCTFLNPPSQIPTCQICLTPKHTLLLPPSSSSSSSSLAIEKWACKACTFLNSYQRSNCEVCDTRYSDPTDPVDDDFSSGLSSVGSIFFPLRRCNSGRIPDSDDLGIKDVGQTQLGSDQFVDHCVKLGGLRSSGSKKRMFQDPVSENAEAVSCFSAKKEEAIVAMKGSASAKFAENAEGSVKFKRKLCDLGEFIEKSIQVDGFREVKSSRKTVSVLDSVNTNSGSVSSEPVENAELKEVSGAIKILSYNVWFREDLEVHKRMQAIGDLIQLHTPDVICFQEVTPMIYDILRSSVWWKKYQCSVSYEKANSQAYFCMQLAKFRVKSFSCKSFSYTAMSRELCVAEIEVNHNNSLVVATSHLESPSPGPPTWDQMYTKERVNQAKEAINFLQKYPNVIFCGDMNWDEKKDGRFPLGEGWFDAWEKLRPAEVGWTYDTKSNKMLTGNRALQKRLDRFICCLNGFEISSIDMVGTEEIPGVTYSKQKKMKNKIQELTLPVLPSDHFGLLLTITS